MARILVIEDEADVRQVLDYNLRTAGHEPLCVATGAEGLRVAREAPSLDLILLDLLLPDIPGTDVCRSLKGTASTKAIPVMMVTAKGEEIDRVVGFELGADDYVVKPFSVRELLLRIRRTLDRHGETPPPSEVVELGRLKIDRAAYRTWVGNDEISLSALEFKLLVTLYEQKNRVLSRECLLEQVWGLGTAVSLRTVDAHVKRLRARLGEAGDYVETVRGVGYRFADERRLRELDTSSS